MVAGLIGDGRRIIVLARYHSPLIKIEGSVAAVIIRVA